MSLSTEIPAGHLQVLVFVPSMVDPKEYAFPPTELVGKAAAQVAADVGIDVSDPTFQNAADVVLDRNQSLRDAGVKKGDRLELVSVGGGV